MDLSNLARRASQLITDNSPVILTAMGVAGVVTTSYLTHKATTRATRLIDASEPEYIKGQPTPEYGRKEKFALVWKLYIPAASTGVMTCTCIVLANRIGTRRAAVVATAFTLAERSAAEYRDKVEELLTPKKSEDIRAALAKDKLDKIQPTDKTVIVTGKGEVWIMEAYTNRVFKGDKETIRKAENDINKQIHDHDYATLSDFYDLLGLDHTSISDDFGWNTSDPLVLDWSTTEHEGNPVLVFDYGVRPFLRPYNMV